MKIRQTTSHLTFSFQTRIWHHCFLCSIWTQSKSVDLESSCLLNETKCKICCSKVTCQTYTTPTVLLTTNFKLEILTGLEENLVSRHKMRRLHHKLNQRSILEPNPTQTFSVVLEEIFFRQVLCLKSIKIGLCLALWSPHPSSCYDLSNSFVCPDTT